MIPLSYLRRIVSANARSRIASSNQRVATPGQDRRFAFENLEDRTTPTSNWIAFGDAVSWHDTNNWDNGVPSGANDAVIGSGFGTIVYSAAAGTTSVTAVNSQSNLSFTGGSLTVTTSFTNTGTLSIGGGTLNITGGTPSNTGSITASTGTLSATGALTAGANLTNSGATVTLTGGGTVAGNFSATGGTTTFGNTTGITGTASISADVGGAGNVTVTGLTTLTSGTMSSGGSWTANGGTTINPAGSYSINGKTYIVNGGTNVWSSGDIFLSNAAVLRVATGQTLTTSVNRTIGRSPAVGAPSVDVQGTLTKLTGVGTTLIDTGVAFNINGGIVNVNTGTLQMRGGGAATGAGALNVAASTTVDFNSGTYTFAGTTAIAGAGAAVFSGGTETISGTYNVTGGFTVSGGAATFALGAVVTSVGTTINVSNGSATFNQGAAMTVTTVNLTGGTLTFSAATPLGATTYNQSGSSLLSGGGNVTVSGVTTFSSGTMSGAGITQADGGLVLSTGTSKTLDSGRILNSAGTGTWSGGTIFVNSSSQLVNQATGTLTATTNDAIQRTSGVGTFANAGIFNKSTGVGLTTIDTFITFTNSGTTNVNAGTLRVVGGGTSAGPINLAAASTLDVNASTFTVGGDITGTGTGAVLVSGGTLNVNGIYSLSTTGTTTVTSGALTLNPAATVTPDTGLGATVAVSGGTATFNSGDALTITTLNLTSNGNVNFTGGSPAAVTTLNQSGNTQLGGTDNVTVSGVTTFTSGTMTGAGQTIANGALNVGGGASVSITNSRQLVVNATGTWSTGDIILDGGGVLSIAATGTLNATGDASIRRSSFGGAGTVSNAGTFAKTGGVGNTTIDTLVTFNNTNIVNVNAGTLLQQGLGTNSGTFNVAATRELRYNGGTYNHNGTSSVLGAGAVRFSGGTVTFDGAYNVTGNITGDGGTATFNPASTVVAIGPTITTSTGSGAINFNNGEPITIVTANLSGSQLNFNNSTDAAVTTLNMSGSAFLGGTSNVTVSGLTSWTGGTMAGTGTTQLNGAATINGVVSVSLNARQLNIGANSTWSGGTIFGDAGSVLTIQPTFTLTITGNNSYSRSTGIGSSSIVVAAGAFLTKSTGVGTTVVTVLTTTTNNGTITVATGTLDLAGGLSNFAANTLTGGTYNITSIFAFNGANIVTNAANVTMNTSTSDIRSSGGGANSGIGNFTTNAAAGVFTLTGNKALTVAGPLTNQGLMNINVGASLLTAASSYTNSAGTTTVNGTLDPFTTVAVSGGTLMGTGTLQSNTLVSGTGNVAPGNSTGILSVVGNIVFSGSSTLTMEINGLTVGTQYDQLNVTGTVGLTSVTLIANGSISASFGDFVTLINNDAADAITGTFTGIASGTTVTVNSQSFVVSYTGGTGNDVSLSRDEAPTDISLSGNIVTSFSPNATVVGNLTGVDADVPPDTLTFTMVNSAGGRFGVSGTQVVVTNGALLDSTVNASHNITVRVTDSLGAFYEEVFNIIVTPQLRVTSVGPVTTPTNLNINTVDVNLNVLAGLPLAGNFDFNDLNLSFNAGPNLIDNTVTVTFVSGTTYQIGNLAGFTAAEGTYVLTVDATSILDAQGQPGILTGTNSVSWFVDTTAPTILSVEVVTPDPRNTQVSTWDVTFSELINISTLTFADFQLLDPGAIDLIAGTESVSFVSGTTYRISGLPTQTVDGLYTLNVSAVAVQDLAGNAGVGSGSDSFTRDATNPTILSVEIVTPDPRTTQVTTWDVTFSELINIATLTFADFQLLDPGAVDLIAGTETVSFVSGTTYRISGLPAQTTDGLYTLNINAAGVQDPAGNAGVGIGTDSFTRDTTGPTILSVEVITPDPRNTQVTTWDVTFSELINIATLTFADFQLLDPGAVDLIAGTETVSFVSGTTYRISGLPAQSTDGLYTLNVSAVGVQDPLGNAGVGSGSDSFTRDTQNPVVLSVEIVTPDPRNTQVTTWDVTLSEVIDLATMTSADFRLFEPGPTNILTGAETVSLVSGTTYRISGLPAQTLQGTHQLNIVLFGVQDAAGNTGANIGVDTWVRDTVGPTITSVEVIAPDPRNTAVASWDVTFSELLDIASIDVNDFTLTLNAGSDLLTAESVTFVSGTTYRISGLTGLTGAAGLYDISIDPTGVTDAAGNAGTGPVASDSWTFASDSTAPTITGIFFAGSAWGAPFRTAAGDVNYGFPGGTGANQLSSLPWSNLNEIVVTFSEAVAAPAAPGLPGSGQVAVRGTNLANYTVTSVTALDAQTWRILLSANIATDWLIVDLDGDTVDRIEDLAGNDLAGTFTESVSTFPTTGAAGVDFEYRFKVVVGDQGRNGTVRNVDLNAVRNNLFIDIGAGGYDIFSDIDANGLIRNADVNAVRNNLFNDAPGAGPSAPNGNRGGRATSSPRATGRGARFVGGFAADAGREESTARRIAPRASAVSALDALFGEM